MTTATPTVIIFLCLIITTFTPGFLAKKFITFQGQHSVTRKLDDIDRNNFEKWFQNENTPLVMLSLNPGIIKLIRISPKGYKCYLKPISFPGCTVTSVIDFDILFQRNQLDMFIREGK